MAIFGLPGAEPDLAERTRTLPGTFARPNGRRSFRRTEVANRSALILEE